MTVSVDGVTRYTWPVSSGNPSHETPNGSFKTFRHGRRSLFEGNSTTRRCRTRSSSPSRATPFTAPTPSAVSAPRPRTACVRLSRANALKLWDLVKAEGLLSTTVTLTGSSQVAIARNPKPRTNVATSRDHRTASPWKSRRAPPLRGHMAKTSTRVPRTSGIA